MKKLFFLISAILGLLIPARATHKPDKKPVVIRVAASKSPRVSYAAELLQKQLNASGYKSSVVFGAGPIKKENISISIGISRAASDRPEGFVVQSMPGGYRIDGRDDSGILYGCLELVNQLKNNGKLPLTVNVNDQPEMVLRGTCIGLQKPYYLPGRTVYEYPYTPETFPWFYDKSLWRQYLDSMLVNKLNSLYLWNGHPFASLVRLKDYPYAVEVDSATFAKNEEIYRFITHEADKRGIWVIQMFYNIIVSKPFAEKHGIKTQDRERPIQPLIADYTRKSIAAFVEKYPNTGLMVCLGEAMEGAGQDDIDWFTKTIIPGVRDGLKELGRKDEPPIVLRAHDTDAPMVMKAALPLYKNLYTEAKFNGEALTTHAPRGAWAELHRTLSRIGTVQIENVHILANLEPFRYASADFIRKSVGAMHTIYEANGLHLYPQASYWDWPYSADKASPRLLQIERDWLWYRQWSRYAWKSVRDSVAENAYWSSLLADKFGCSLADGQQILRAFEESGEIAPKLLRRFGITDGNRQTLTLGMLMAQLINPHRFGLFTLLYESESPEGEMIIDYAEKEWKRLPHIGETPVQIINEVRIHGKKAVDAVNAAAVHVTKNKEEFERIKNDMLAYHSLALHYSDKVSAAIAALRYKYSSDVSDLKIALPLLRNSVEHYRTLAALTSKTYLYANSMQTQQRKIPIRGVDGTFKTWSEVLIPFEKELKHFERKIDSLSVAGKSAVTSRAALVNAELEVAGMNDRYITDSGQTVFSDTASMIISVATPLRGMKGYKLSGRQLHEFPAELKFEARKPVTLLVGYFNTKDPGFAKAPELETNASANEYGQAEPRIANAIVLKGMPPVNVHSYSFPAGTHQFRFPRGKLIIFGFTHSAVPVYDAGLTEKEIKKEIDWLFE